MAGRELSAPATAALVAEETDEVFLDLIIIEHEELATPIRVVRNVEDVEIDGETYAGLPFEIELPDEGERPGDLMLTIDNVDRRIVNTIRSIQSPPTVTYRLVLASQPEVIEYEAAGLTLRDCTYDVAQVRGYMRYEPLVTESVADTITPSRFPALF